MTQPRGTTSQRPKGGGLRPEEWAWAWAWAWARPVLALPEQPPSVSQPHLQQHLHHLSRRPPSRPSTKQRPLARSPPVCCAGGSAQLGGACQRINKRMMSGGGGNPQKKVRKASIEESEKAQEDESRGWVGANCPALQPAAQASRKSEPCPSHTAAVSSTHSRSLAALPPPRRSGFCTQLQERAIGQDRRCCCFFVTVVTADAWLLLMMMMMMRREFEDAAAAAASMAAGRQAASQQAGRRRSCARARARVQHVRG